MAATFFLETAPARSLGTRCAGPTGPRATCAVACPRQRGRSPGASSARVSDKSAPRLRRMGLECARQHTGDRAYRAVGWSSCGGIPLSPGPPPSSSPLAGRHRRRRAAPRRLDDHELDVERGSTCLPQARGMEQVVRRRVLAIGSATRVALSRFPRARAGLASLPAGAVWRWTRTLCAACLRAPPCRRVGCSSTTGVRDGCSPRLTRGRARIMVARSAVT